MAGSSTSTCAAPATSAATARVSTVSSPASMAAMMARIRSHTADIVGRVAASTVSMASHSARSAGGCCAAQSFGARGSVSLLSFHLTLPLIAASWRLPPTSPASPSKGLRPPFMAANSTAPSAQTSTLASTLPCDGGSNSSGALYEAVTCASANSASSSASRRLDNSTSHSRALPRSMTTARARREPRSPARSLFPMPAPARRAAAAAAARAERAASLKPLTRMLWGLMS
mmetsp:Transcript_10874/g.45080  ORF Transcript_10874/g.45080 Transcript_10874/m.45080 type:complete len:230 (-) Transcript_10874:653-1342(-)